MNRRARLAALAVPVALAAWSCSGNETPGAFCPAVGNRGPVLDGGAAHVVVVNSLGEDWVSAPAGPGGTPLFERGLTGRTPNDVDIRGDLMVTVNSGENTLSLTDLATGITGGCIDLGTGANPWEFVFDPVDSARGWVTTFLSGELIEVDLETRQVVRRREVGPALEGLVVTADRIAVTLTGFNGTEGDFGEGAVVVLARPGLAESARLPVPTNPQFLFVDSGGRLHAICSGNFRTDTEAIPGRAVRTDALWSAVTDTVELGGSPARAVETGGRVYVAAFFGGLMSYRAADMMPLRTAADPILDEIGFTDLLVHDGLLYATLFDLDAVAILDTGTDETVGSWLAGDGPVGIAIHAP